MKIADFGLATLLPEDPTVKINEKCGTPCYMAPESLRDQGYREKFDIFSLGSVFFNLLSGHFMFNGESVDEQLRLNRACDLSLLPMYLESISEQCFQLLFKMIDPDPEKRPSATEALRHLWFKQDEEVI